MAAFTTAERAAIRNAQRFGSESRMQALIKDVPALFSQHPHPKMSEKYAFTNTYEIVKNIMDLGYTVDSVQQTGMSKFAKIMVKMRSRFWKSEGDYAQIVVINSHDGTAALKFIGGWMRLVCSNGMVVGKHMMHQSIKHNSPTMAADIRLGLIDVEDHLQLVSRNINDMRARIVSKDEAHQLALAAATSRFPDQHERFIRIVAGQLLTINRMDDRASDLYTVMNRIQENTLRGGPVFAYEGRRVRLQPVNAIDRNVSLNQTIWGEATKLLEAA